MLLLDMKLFFILGQNAQIWFSPLKLFILVHRPDKTALKKLLLHRFTDVRVETALAQHTASADMTGQERRLCCLHHIMNGPESRGK